MCPPPSPPSPSPWFGFCFLLNLLKIITVKNNQNVCDLPLVGKPSSLRGSRQSRWRALFGTKVVLETFRRLWRTWRLVAECIHAPFVMCFVWRYFCHVTCRSETKGKKNHSLLFQTLRAVVSHIVHANVYFTASYSHVQELKKAGLAPDQVLPVLILVCVFCLLFGF